MQATINKQKIISLDVNASALQWVIIGGGKQALKSLKHLLHFDGEAMVTVVAEEVDDIIKRIAVKHTNVVIAEKEFAVNELIDENMFIINTGNAIVDEKIFSSLKQSRGNVLCYLPDNDLLSDFILPAHLANKKTESKYWLNDQSWKQITTKLIIVFLLMVIGHIVISYLPLPTTNETWQAIKPHFNYQFLFFVVAGFLAQMVDGMLSMGYGVTSATCLMTFGVNPVAMSASIHTSEIFTTGISGYSHYRFGNVNKKLFKLLVIPGVIGAVAGAAALSYIGDKYADYLMPIVALYAGFLGLRILFKAFKEPTKGKKVKRLGWLAWAGGFLDSFGGGGWGPLVTSSLVAKGRSPKYTVGSVSLTEFFVTLSSAFTFFMMVGVSHWNIVLGLLIGGSIAAPIAARLAGKLPRKTMMILVGIMVMIWCVRMIIKSLHASGITG